MNKAIPITLWTLVLAFGGFTFYYLKQPKDNKIPESNPLTQNAGAIYKSVPWKHFQHVPPFQFTDQDNQDFDSRTLAGRPYVVSFFFSTCPTICRDLNKQIQSLRERVDDPELAFISISVDPENDTPEALNRYAAEFDANVDDWKFLTGDLYKVSEVGEHAFQVVVDKFTHTDNILLVDRWGRYRDRFKWDDPYDMKRFLSVTKDVLAEQSPPMDESFETRNLMAGVVPSDLNTVKWIRDFHLTDQNGDAFFSRDLTGEVWIGNFFFSTCPTVCVEQNEYLAGLQKRLKDHPARIVSITTQPGTDTPSVLKDYAQKMGADLSSWSFLTGNESLIKRVGAEYFRAPTSNEHHSSRLFVVDRWGQVRGSFDWKQSGDEVQMLKLIDQLNLETKPTIQ